MSSKVPLFDSDGLLPVGDYEVTFDELRTSVLVDGPAHRTLYPHWPGLHSGIQDQYGNELEFPSAFRQSRRSGKPRGIIKMMEDAHDSK